MCSSNNDTLRQDSDGYFIFLHVHICLSIIFLFCCLKYRLSKCLSGCFLSVSPNDLLDGAAPCHLLVFVLCLTGIRHCRSRRRSRSWRRLLRFCIRFTTCTKITSCWPTSPLTGLSPQSSLPLKCCYTFTYRFYRLPRTDPGIWVSSPSCMLTTPRSWGFAALRAPPVSRRLCPSASTRCHSGCEATDFS